MKKVKVLFGIFASLAMIVGMASCSKEDDGIDNNASNIGTWGCVHNTYTYIRSNNPDNPTHREDDYVGRIIVFKEDGTYTATDEFKTSMFDYFKGGSWMIDGSILYLTGNFKMHIRQLTKDKLVLYNKFWFDGNDFGFDEPPSDWYSWQEVFFEFRRQQ